MGRTSYHSLPAADTTLFCAVLRCSAGSSLKNSGMAKTLSGSRVRTGTPATKQSLTACGSALARSRGIIVDRHAAVCQGQNRQSVSSTTEVNGYYIWQPPPQHRGAAQLSPEPATGKLDLLFTAGADGILKTRCKSAFPQLGQAFSSAEERTSSSTTLSQDLHSNS